ncbi:MAG: hypothetical protein WCE38_10480 [Burkholderiales bacterium]
MRRIPIGRLGVVGLLIGLVAVSSGTVRALERELVEQRHRLDQQLRELHELEGRLTGRGAAP